MAPPPLQHRPFTYPPLYPPVGEDILNVQANARLAAHLREEPAPHILEEDAEPNEDLAGEGFTYSQETTTAFQELLTLIDSNTRGRYNVPPLLVPVRHLDHTLSEGRKIGE